MPASYLVILQPEAEQDLDQAFAYYEEQLSGLGLQLMADLSDAISILEENPFLFQKIHGEKRRIVIHHFGYNVIYKIVGDYVYILAIMHGSRSTRQWKDRE